MVAHLSEQRELLDALIALRVIDEIPVTALRVADLEMRLDNDRNSYPRSDNSGSI